MPKAIKGLEPSAWQVNRPTWLQLQQHTSQTMRGLQDAEQQLLPPVPTRVPAQDDQATLKAAISCWLKPSSICKYGLALLDQVLAGFQAEVTAKPARLAAPAVAQGNNHESAALLERRRRAPQDTGRVEPASYSQHKGDTVAQAGASGSAGAAVGGKEAAPPPAPATPAKPVWTRAEWEAALPNLGFIRRHIAQPP